MNERGEQYSLEVRGARLRLRASGAGPALLWAHGLMSSMAAEQKAGAWRSASPCRLLRWDARGHGASSAIAPGGAREATWDNLAQDLLALADAHGLSSFAAGGISMGAATALCAALRAPQRVRRLLLVAPPALWEERVVLADQYRRIVSADARVIARMVDSVVHSGRRPGWLRGAPAVPLDPASLANAAPLYLAAAHSDLPPRTELARLADTPALIVGWEDDGAHPLASACELHRLLPRSRLHVVTSLREYLRLQAVVSTEWRTDAWD